MTNRLCQVAAVLLLIAGSVSAQRAPAAIVRFPANQGVGVTASAGQNLTLSAKFAAIPAPNFQWSRNGAAIPGATGTTLNLNSVRVADAGRYTVTATNTSGRVTSTPAVVTVR